MSYVELRAAVDLLSREERNALRDYLETKYPEDYLIDRRVLDERMDRMEAGRKVPWETVEAMLKIQETQPK